MSVNYKAMRVRMTDAQARACTADLHDQRPPLVGFHVIGKCPRCHHDTHDLFPVEYLAGQDAEAASTPAGTAGTAPAAPAPQVEHVVGVPQVADADLLMVRATWSLTRTVVTVMQPGAATAHTDVALQRCRCIENHAGAKGSYGCGATWLIAATYSPSHTARPVTFAAVSDAEAFLDWEGAASRAQSAASALTTVRTAATTWQATLTAILGLVAVLAVVGGRSTLQGLTFWPQVAVGVAVAAAVAANGWAIYQASLAATGFPGFKRTADLPALVDADEGPTAQANAAVRHLQLARASAAVSLVAGMIAVGFVWYGSGVPSTSATLVLTTGQSVCGSIATTDLTKNSGEIMFTSNGTTKPYPVNEIAQISVGSC